MKKSILVAVAIVGVLLSGVINSEAFITISWDSTGAWDATSASGAGLADGSVYQLIWSADNIMDLVGSDGSATGGDMVLATGGTVHDFGFGGFIRGHGADPFVFGDAGAVDNAALVAGYVYLRVFDAQAGGIAVGTDYWQGGMIGGSLTDSPGTPDAYDKTDPTGGAFVAMDMVVVPEPATMALFGLGLAVLGLRKRRK